MWPSIKETQGLSRGWVVMGLPSWVGGDILAVLGCGSSWGQWSGSAIPFPALKSSGVASSACLLLWRGSKYISVALVRGQFWVRPNDLLTGVSSLSIKKKNGAGQWISQLGRDCLFIMKLCALLKLGYRSNWDRGVGLTLPVGDKRQQGYPAVSSPREYVSAWLYWTSIKDLWLSMGRADRQASRGPQCEGPVHFSSYLYIHPSAYLTTTHWISVKFHIGNPH